MKKTTPICQLWIHTMKKSHTFNLKCHWLWFNETLSRWWNLNVQHAWKWKRNGKESTLCGNTTVFGPPRDKLIRVSHLLQADTRPLDQSLKSGNSFILPQQEGVERGGQISITLVRDHVSRSEAPIFGLAVTGVNVSLWSHTKGHKHLWDLLNELQLVWELGQLLRQLNEVIVDVHKTQVSLQGDTETRE